MRRLFCMLALLWLVSPGMASADSPTPPPIAPMALNSYRWAPAAIVTAPVTDLQNDVIGRVQKLDYSPAGAPLGVDILLAGSGRVIHVPSSNLSYDQARNILTAGLDRAAIRRMTQPAGPK